MSFARLTAWVLVLLIASAGGRLQADEPARVFELRRMPDLNERFARVQRSLAQQELAAAGRELRQLIDLTPKSPEPYYHLARVLAQQGEPEAAMVQLDRAVDRGFFEVRALATDQALRPLHDDPRFRDIAQRALGLTRDVPESIFNPFIQPPEAVEETLIDGGVARVGEANTIPHAQQGFFRTYFHFPDEPADLPAVVRGDDDEVAALLNRWYERGAAAGNHGDLYDNRDGGHSRLNADLFPQLTHLRYDQAARRHGLATSVQRYFLFNHVTLGNCSMALGHEVYWRSLPRMLMTDRSGIPFAQLQYGANHLYVYPSHHDHRSQDGDVFPANTPYMIISQGSSGSDQPFLRAIASTLAAFQPEVKRRLTRTGLLMPTVQMIFRHGSRHVRDAEDYLRGSAHPTVFRSEDLDVRRMVEMAQAMEADRLPPLVRLEVLEESLGELGRDYFAPAEREKLFDTHGAIARIHRSTDYTKKMVVSAANSADIDGRDLDWRWVVLRGDAERITMRPRTSDESIMEIEVSYQGRGRVPGSDLSSNRVDIGVFAHNGHHYSAPAFISIYTIPSERRRYSENGRIERVDYADPHVSRRYTDPMLALPKDWADEYFYDGEGRLLGWTRIRGNERQRFTRDGARVLDTDDRGRPTRARTVRYVPQERGDDQPPLLTQQPGDTILHYEYEGPGDPIGRVTRREEAE